MRKLPRRYNIYRILSVVSALAIFTLFAPLLSTANAQVPQFINYQGKLKDSGGNPLTGTYDFRMRIYDDPTAGTLLYADEHAGINVRPGGIFNVAIGSGTVMTPPNQPFSSLEFTEPYYLSVEVGQNGVWDGEMTPRVPLATYMYAFNSQQLEGHSAGNGADDVLVLDSNGDINFAGNIITTGNIESGAITVEESEYSAFAVFEDTSNAVSTSIHVGNGSPENIVVAGAGSLYLDEAGNVFVKESGTGNTGWVELATITSVGNIYNTDGTLTGNRVVDAGGHLLRFHNNWIDYDIRDDSSAIIADDGNARSRFDIEPTFFQLYSQDAGSLAQSSIQGDPTGEIILTSNSTGAANDRMRVIVNTDQFDIVTDDTTFRGATYDKDYSANFTDRSLVDKQYVDKQLMWEIVNGGERIQPKDNSVRQIFVEENSNSYTQFKVVNNNDTGNVAGAIIELKGSGADFTNNMYIGKYGAAFWIPELQDNGAVLTDKNLVIGTASASNEIHFVAGNSYSDLRPVVVADNEGFRYTSDLSATYVDRTLVDKGYVDSLVSTSSFWVPGTAGTYSIRSTGNAASGGDAQGNYSVAMGYNTRASTYFAMAEGTSTLANGEGSHAEGRGSHALANASHSEGQQTVASGYSSHAEGNNTRATGIASHAEGLLTVAQNAYQYAGGIYNVGTATDTIHEIGIGTGASNRMNAFEVYTDGSILAPEFSIAEINARGSSSLTTKEYVDNAISTGANNIYNNDGTVVTDRTVTFDDKVLDFMAVGDNSEYNLDMSDTAGANSYFSMLPDEMEFNSAAAGNGPASNMIIGSTRLGFHHDDGTNNLASVTVSDDIIIEDGIHNRGAVYLADYSANYTDRSLVDKGYVDAAITNGKQTLQGVVDTSIAKDGYVTADMGAGVIEDDGGLLFVEAHAGKDFDYGAEGFLVFSLAGGMGDAGHAYVSDYRNAGSRKGLEYSADYSADYTDRSLVDKGYVDSLNKKLWDADHDTGIQVEEASDEDKIRFDTVGIQRMVIDENGHIGLNTENFSHDVLFYGNVSTTVNVLQSNSTMAGINIDRFSDDVEPARFAMDKARGTESAPAIIQSGDEIIEMSGAAYDGSQYISAGGFIVKTDGTPAANSIPTRLTFLTTRAGALGSDEKMVLTSEGELGIGNLDPDSALHVTSVSGQVGEAILTLENSTGDTQVFNVDNNPENYVTGSVGDIAIDNFHGDMYIKHSGDATDTGWLQLAAGGGSLSPWTRSGTDLSPTTAGDDVVLNTGETLSIVDLAQGSIPFIGAGGMVMQDNSNLYWDDTNNRLGIGTDSPGHQLTLAGDGTSNADASLEMAVYADSGQPAGLYLHRARGSDSSPTAIVDTLPIGGIMAGGYDGTAMVEYSAGIQMDATEDWSSTAHGTRIFFSTTENGTTGMVNRMVIDDNGNIGIGTTSPDYELQVDGTIAPETTDTLGLGTSALRWDLYADEIDVNSLTVNSLLNAPRSNTAPASPVAGTIYFNTADNKLKAYDGTTWHDLY